MLAKALDRTWKINWRHVKYDEPQPLLTAKERVVYIKGYTQCEITDVANEQDTTAGFAWCSTEDNFNKEKGRKRSLTVALSEMKLPREERAKVWAAYFGRGGLSGV